VGGCGRDGPLVSIAIEEKWGRHIKKLDKLWAILQKNGFSLRAAIKQTTVSGKSQLSVFSGMLATKRAGGDLPHRAKCKELLEKGEEGKRENALDLKLELKKQALAYTHMGGSEFFIRKKTAPGRRAPGKRRAKRGTKALGRWKILNKENKMRRAETARFRI